MRADFDRSFNMSLEINKTFHEKITAIFEKKHVYSSTFCDCTGLEPMMFTRMNRPGYNPNMRTVMSVCVGLGLDVLTTESLLKSAGLAFSPVNRVHFAYIYLLENCKGMNIEDCNNILESFGIDKKDFLGTIPRK